MPRRTHTDRPARVETPSGRAEKLAAFTYARRSERGKTVGLQFEINLAEHAAQESARRAS
jgi:hypothetical protein